MTVFAQKKKKRKDNVQLNSMFLKRLSIFVLLPKQQLRTIRLFAQKKKNHKTVTVYINGLKFTQTTTTM